MGFGIVVFADLAIRIGARSIEVTQSNPVQAVSPAKPRQHFFRLKLGFTIRIDRFRGSGFRDWNMIRNPVDRTGRRKDQICDAHLRHRFQEIERSHHIVAKIPTGNPDRFPDIGQSSEMNDRFDFESVYCLSNFVLVEKVSDNQRPPFDRRTESASQIVECDRVVAPTRQFLASMASNIAGTTRNQNVAAHRAEPAKSSAASWLKMWP